MIGSLLKKNTSPSSEQNQQANQDATIEKKEAILQEANDAIAKLVSMNANDEAQKAKDKLEKMKKLE